jgi:hypothetical protein
MGGSTSNNATAGIALRVSGVLKPHHNDKVETPSVRLQVTTAVDKITVFWNVMCLIGTHVSEGLTASKFRVQSFLPLHPE